MSSVYQPNFFSLETLLSAPNVSQVPQYSAFRFPGGKTWFYPFAKSWMRKLRDKTLIEPFAGGASIGLAAAIENWVRKVILIEIDPDIYSVWKCIFSEHEMELSKLILDFNMDEVNLNERLNMKTNNLTDIAFNILLRNRTNHGGILANGSGKLKFGEGGKGILSRWYPKTLSYRIARIGNHSNKFEILNGDGIKMIEQFSIDSNNIFFIDPPYTIAGKRLYDYYELDHNQLLYTLHNIGNDFILTYDDSPFIIELIKKYNFKYERILMTTTHHKKKYELMISNQLNWLI